MSKTVMDLIVSNVDKAFLEEILWEEGILFEEGMTIEAYGNPDGKYSDSSEGRSVFFVMGETLTYGEVLNHLSDLGSVKDDTLTLRIVEDDEDPEFDFCQENILYKSGFQKEEE